MSSNEDLERRVSQVEAELSVVRQETAAARALAAGADRDVAEYRAELRGHTRVLSALRETQLEHYAELKADVNGLRTDVSGLKADMSILTADMSVLKTDVGGLKTDVSVLKEDVSVLKTDVGGLKTDVSVLKEDVGGLKTDVSVLKEDVGGLKVDVSNLRAGMADVQSGVALIVRLLDGPAGAGEAASN